MGRPKGSMNKKSIWLMESLAQHGYDYEKMLTGFLEKAAKGDRLALDMAHLLVKLVPYLANMPKQDTGMAQIETLVINRYEVAAPKRESIEGEIVDGHDDIHEGTPPQDAVTESRKAEA